MKLGVIRLYLWNDTCIGYTETQQHVHTKRTTIVFNACRTTVGKRPSAPSEWVSPMASVGKAYSCPPAQSPETKLQIMLVENETVDAGIDDEAIEAQRPNVVAVGRGPSKLEVAHHAASVHTHHRTL